MKPFGADRMELEADGVCRLFCSASKGWSGRLPRTALAPEFPGTAVRWEDELFEVREALPQADGGVHYRLAPWEHRHAAREVSGYDEASEAARLQEQARRRNDLALRRLGLLLSPLIGHLPARVQQRLERERGLSAQLLTIASALPLLVIGVLGTVASLIASLGGGEAAFAGWPLPSLTLSIFLFLESAVRLSIAFLQGEPMGSLAGTLAYEVWWRATGRGTPPSWRYARGPRAEAPEEGKESP
jgi:hypothetical protein